MRGETLGSSVPPSITALSLSPHADRHRAEALLALCDHLLSLLAEHAPDTPSLEADAFRRQLAAWRHELQHEEDAARVARLRRDVAAECGRFLDRTRAYRTDRESELIDLVNVLREVVDAVRGDSLQFEHKLVRSTTAMSRMVEIEDIRELKHALSREVHTLREAVAERQVSEAKHHATLTGRVQSLEQSLVKAQAQAATDALTALPNRGAFDLAIRAWLQRAASDGQAFTVAMVDLDDFKRINDSYGHPIGDRVIVAAAQLLQSGVVEGELVSRFGGEEFALLLRSAGAAQARERITALLQRLPASYEFEDAGQRRFVTFTFSGGVTASVAGDTAESIVKRADEALYDAKRRGKKRVETQPQSFLRGLMR